MEFKKISSAALISAAIFLPASAYAAAPSDIVFKQEQGGKYIYCNNIESITLNDLADKSCRTAKYLMNNRSLTPDRYVFFGVFLNRTDTVSGGALSGKTGFDIDVDVVFEAKEDTVLDFTRMGFEVPQHEEFFLDGTHYSSENEWGGFGAWASFMGSPIHQINSGNVYEPENFAPVSVTLKKGDRLWLSRMTENYRSVPLARSVHIVADFRIVSGSCDVNVAALRSTGTPGDRRYFKPDSAFGAYRRDKQYKGISDGLNEVTAELSYTIDDSDINGSCLPVTVYNHYKPEGNTIEKWYTQLNPRADEWSYDICAESDMLSFVYQDPTKKLLYGSAIPESEKNDLYIFDTAHTDQAVYDRSCGSRSSYIPNRELTDNDGNDLACNLGNYGVIYNYNIEITNTGVKRRYLIYNLATSSNNLVWVKDKDGNIINDRILSKGSKYTRISDPLTCLAIPAQSTVKYTICVLLTANYPGGMENNLQILDHQIPIETYRSDRSGILKDSMFDGKEYYSWINGVLNLSPDGEVWSAVDLPVSVKDSIGSNLSEYRLEWTGSGYTLRPTLYDAGEFWYVDYLYKDVYLFDENFALIKKQTFGAYPSDYECANGVHYVKLLGTAFRSDTDFKWWDPTALDMPCWNYGRFSAICSGGDISLSVDGKNFDKVKYLDYKPEYIDAYDRFYYCADGMVLSLSPDGLHWRHLLFNDKVRTYKIADGFVTVNGNERQPVPEFNETVAIKKDGEYISLPAEALLIDDSPYIPLRAVGEMLDYRVRWDNGTVIYEKGGRQTEIKDILMIGDTSYAPLNVLINTLDHNVDYDETYRIATIK